MKIRMVLDFTGDFADMEQAQSFLATLTMGMRNNYISTPGIMPRDVKVLGVSTQSLERPDGKTAD